MRRKLFTLAAGVSAVLCAASLAACLARGHPRAARKFSHAGQLWEVALRDGRFCLDNGPECSFRRRQWRAALLAAEREVMLATEREVFRSDGRGWADRVVND